jgi:hypothetical protein
LVVIPLVEGVSVSTGELINATFSDKVPYLEIYNAFFKKQDYHNRFDFD